MSNDKVFKFKVGDKAEFGGLFGEVIRASNVYCEAYPVRFRDIFGTETSFTIDGKLHKDHTKPLLVLVERPKRKVKKVLSGWVNVYSNKKSIPYDKKDDADIGAMLSLEKRIACVEVKGEYEVDEDV